MGIPIYNLEDSPPPPQPPLLPRRFSNPGHHWFSRSHYRPETNLMRALGGGSSSGFETWGSSSSYGMMDEENGEEEMRGILRRIQQRRAGLGLGSSASGGGLGAGGTSVGGGDAEATSGSGTLSFFPPAQGGNGTARFRRTALESGLFAPSTNVSIRDSGSSSSSGGGGGGGDVTISAAASAITTTRRRRTRAELEEDDGEEEDEDLQAFLDSRDRRRRAWRAAIVDSLHSLRSTILGVEGLQPLNPRPSGSRTTRSTSENRGGGSASLEQRGSSGVSETLSALVDVRRRLAEARSQFESDIGINRTSEATGSSSSNPPSSSSTSEPTTSISSTSRNWGSLLSNSDDVPSVPTVSIFAPVPSRNLYSTRVVVNPHRELPVQMSPIWRSRRSLETAVEALRDSMGGSSSEGMVVTGGLHVGGGEEGSGSPSVESGAEVSSAATAQTSSSNSTQRPLTSVSSTTAAAAVPATPSTANVSTSSTLPTSATLQRSPLWSSLTQAATEALPSTQSDWSILPPPSIDLLPPPTSTLAPPPSLDPTRPSSRLASSRASPTLGPLLGSQAPRPDPRFSPGFGAQRPPLVGAVSPRLGPAGTPATSATAGEVPS
ncbi:hypothetical protein HDV05_008186 [Chytridiales sp. JEL 0842]|nr:hypothetical protein HDV05_008186 [Chytridiales sp. JEL 0842]